MPPQKKWKKNLKEARQNKKAIDDTRKTKSEDSQSNCDVSDEAAQCQPGTSGCAKSVTQPKSTTSAKEKTPPSHGSTPSSPARYRSGKSHKKLQVARERKKASQEKADNQPAHSSVFKVPAPRPRRESDCSSSSSKSSNTLSSAASNSTTGTRVTRSSVGKVADELPFPGLLQPLNIQRWRENRPVLTETESEADDSGDSTSSRRSGRPEKAKYDRDARGRFSKASLEPKNSDEEVPLALLVKKRSDANSVSQVDWDDEDDVPLKLLKDRSQRTNSTVRDEFDILEDTPLSDRISADSESSFRQDARKPKRLTKKKPPKPQTPSSKPDEENLNNRRRRQLRERLDDLAVEHNVYPPSFVPPPDPDPPGPPIQGPFVTSDDSGSQVLGRTRELLDRYQHLYPDAPEVQGRGKKRTAAATASNSRQAPPSPPPPGDPSSEGDDDETPPPSPPRPVRLPPPPSQVSPTSEDDEEDSNMENEDEYQVTPQHSPVRLPPPPPQVSTSSEDEDEEEEATQQEEHPSPRSVIMGLANPRRSLRTPRPIPRADVEIPEDENEEPVDPEEPPPQFANAQFDEDYPEPVNFARQIGLPVPPRIRHPRQPLRGRAVQVMGNVFEPDYRRPEQEPARFLHNEDRRNYHTAVNHGTFNIARGPVPDEVEPFSMGRLGGDADDPNNACICIECGALHFPKEVEQLGPGPFACCDKGKVHLEDPEPYPEELLILKESFRDRLRHLNCMLSLAAYKARRVNLPGFPWIYKILGTAQLDLPMGNGKTPFVAVIDPSEAREEIRATPGGQYLEPELIDGYLRYLRENNPLFLTYLRMVEVMEEQKEQGEEAEVTLVLKDAKHNRQTLEHHTHRRPVVETELALLYDAGIELDEQVQYIYKNGQKQRLWPTNPFRESFTYPVMFPKPHLGWNPDLKKRNLAPGRLRDRLTLRDYIRHRLHRRSPLQTELNCGSLTQQYIVEAYTRIVENELSYIRHNLPQDLMLGCRKDLETLFERIAVEQNYQIGKSFVLPKSFADGDSHMQKLYRQCLASVRKTGMPNFFLTMTANPKHPDVVNHPDYRAHDGSLNVDLTARVFAAQLRELKHDLRVRKVLGNVRNIMCVTEFQKRGLPHVHMVITTDHKLVNPDDVDQYVTCRVPNPTTEPVLHDLVTRFMVHKTCSSRCLDDRGKCRRFYPMDYREETELHDGNDHVAIKRPRGGYTITLDGTEYDTRNVVPYNPWLLKKYRCHLNLVPFVNLKQARYLFKYITKGPDMAKVELTAKKFGYRIQNPRRMSHLDRLMNSLRTQDERRPPGQGGGDAAGAPVDGNGGDERQNVKVLIDELKDYMDCRYLTASEAIWRIFGYPMSYFLYACLEMSVHTAEQQPVVWRDGDEHNAAMRPLKDTHLVAYFELNNRQDLPEADRELLERLRFVDVPQYFKFDVKSKKWSRRSPSSKMTIGSLYSVSPKDTERFYLRALLQHRMKPLGYEDLKTFEGETYATFRETAIAMGLVRGDYEYRRCLTEAVVDSSPFSVRLLFLMLLLHCEPSEPRVLFDEFWQDMAGSFRRGAMTDQEVKDRLLRYFARKLVLNNAHLDEELFRGIDVDLDDDDFEFDEAPEAPILPGAAERQANYDRLNDEQKDIFHTIVDSVMDYKHGVPREKSTYFMEGPAGTGKTFTYKVIYDHLMANGCNVMCMSFTGVAAALLPGGRTLHSGLGLPVPLTSKSESRLKRNMPAFKRLRECDLLIIDEVSMAPVHAYTAADKIIKLAKSGNVNETFDMPSFAGMPVLFGGDLRQLSPICGPNETEAQIHFRNSDYLRDCVRMSLTTNMRANADERDFAELLKSVGEGSQPTDPELPENSFLVPDEWMTPNNTLEEMVDWAFGENPAESGVDTAILTHLNEDCRLINSMVLQKLPGETVHLLSEDTLDDDEPGNPLVADAGAAWEDRRTIDLDELHVQNPPSCPDHDIPLRVGAIVILIRNLDVSAGLVNGTRMRVKEITRTRLRVEVLSGGEHIRGKTVDLSRIIFKADIGAICKMSRTQFPIKMAFAMTINKSQGMTLRKVGVYLGRYLSDHGKLYVALSRVRRHQDIRLVIKRDDRQGYHSGLRRWFTQNPVKRQLWDLTMDRELVEAQIRHQPIVVRPRPQEAQEPVVDDDGFDNPHGYDSDNEYGDERNDEERVNAPRLPPEPSEDDDDDYDAGDDSFPEDDDDDDAPPPAARYGESVVCAKATRAFREPTRSGDGIVCASARRLPPLPESFGQSTGAIRKTPQGDGIVCASAKRRAGPAVPEWPGATSSTPRRAPAVPKRVRVMRGSRINYREESPSPERSAVSADSTPAVSPILAQAAKRAASSPLMLSPVVNRLPTPPDKSPPCSPRSAGQLPPFEWNPEEALELRTHPHPFSSQSKIVQLELELEPTKHSSQPVLMQSKMVKNNCENGFRCGSNACVCWKLGQFAYDYWRFEPPPIVTPPSPQPNWGPPPPAYDLSDPMRYKVHDRPQTLSQPLLKQLEPPKLVKSTSQPVEHHSALATNTVRDGQMCSGLYSYCRCEKLFRFTTEYYNDFEMPHTVHEGDWRLDEVGIDVADWRDVAEYDY